MRVIPMSNKKLSANIFTVGWRSTNRPIGPAKTIMNKTATTTAETIMPIWLTMPTAVITESKEKTASSRRIWMITVAKVGATWAEECPSSPSNFWWVSWVLLAMRNSPADQKDEVAPEISCAKT